MLEPQVLVHRVCITYGIRSSNHVILQQTDKQEEDAYNETTKNGEPALKGTCSICGAGQFRIRRL